VRLTWCFEHIRQLFKKQPMVVVKCLVCSQDVDKTKETAYINTAGIVTCLNCHHNNKKQVEGKIDYSLFFGNF
jgi:hypothetical protein